MPSIACSIAIIFESMSRCFHATKRTVGIIT
jgi:hypothetical protein